MNDRKKYKRKNDRQKIIKDMIRYKNNSKKKVEEVQKEIKVIQKIGKIFLGYFCLISHKAQTRNKVIPLIFGISTPFYRLLEEIFGFIVFQIFKLIKVKVIIVTLNLENLYKK